MSPDTAKLAATRLLSAGVNAWALSRLRQTSLGGSPWAAGRARGRANGAGVRRPESANRKGGAKKHVRTTRRQVKWQKGKDKDAGNSTGSFNP